MGLALLIVIFKALALRVGEERYNEVARFWTRIFALNFAMGVVTGIPLEFQFGTNWARFSRYAGEVVGQTLAIEGVFAFVLESAFLGLFLFGEKRLGQLGHLAVAVALLVGSWLSGYFIIVANAFMQHPVGHRADADGLLHLADLRTFLCNPWAFWQYLHNMAASVVTASFVVSAVGAYWSLAGRHAGHARICLRVGVIAGLVSCVLIAFPTGDGQGKLVALHQPATLAAMEGLFHGGPYAELAIIGQPDVRARRLENPVVVPGILSFLAYGTFGSTVKGLERLPRGRMAAQRGAALLHVPHHGGPGDDSDAGDLGRGAVPLAGHPAPVAHDALDPHALVAVPVHRDDRRLVDGRAGPAALDHLRAAPHQRRVIKGGQHRGRGLHDARLRGPVSHAQRAFPVPAGARDLRGPVSMS